MEIWWPDVLKLDERLWELFFKLRNVIYTKWEKKLPTGYVDFMPIPSNLSREPFWVWLQSDGTIFAVRSETMQKRKKCRWWNGLQKRERIYLGVIYMKISTTKDFLVLHSWTSTTIAKLATRMDFYYVTCEWI